MAHTNKRKELLKVKENRQNGRKVGIENVEERKEGRNRKERGQGLPAPPEGGPKVRGGAPPPAGGGRGGPHRNKRKKEMKNKGWNVPAPKTKKTLENETQECYKSTNPLRLIRRTRSGRTAAG